MTKLWRVTAIRMATALVLATSIPACSAAPGSSASNPAQSASPSPAAGSAAAAPSIPAGFPIGTWETTISADDLRASGVTHEGELRENAGRFTLTMNADGTWTTAQQADVELHWPVFRGTWAVTGADRFSQRTELPADFAGEVVEFAWRMEGEALRLDVVNPPDHILPIIMESHPWQPVR